MTVSGYEERVTNCDVSAWRARSSKRPNQPGKQGNQPRRVSDVKQLKLLRQPESGQDLNSDGQKFQLLIATLGKEDGIPAKEASLLDQDHAARPSHVPGAVRWHQRSGQHDGAQPEQAPETSHVQDIFTAGSDAQDNEKKSHFETIEKGERDILIDAKNEPSESQNIESAQPPYGAAGAQVNANIAPLGDAAGRPAQVQVLESIKDAFAPQARPMVLADKAPVKSLVVKLRPDGLGEVIVRLSMAKGALQVGFASTNEDTLGMLKSASPELVQGLQKLHPEFNDQHLNFAVTDPSALANSSPQSGNKNEYSRSPQGDARSGAETPQGIFNAKVSRTAAQTARVVGPGKRGLGIYL